MGPDESGPTAAALLEGLFRIHGPPLVLKVDNGSAFRSRRVRKLLADHGVQVLYSPVRTPSYNGSIEASVGANKARAEQHAERFGISGVWTWEDVEAARQEGNVFGRSPFDAHRNPDQVWQGREPLRAEEREALSAEVKRIQEEETDSEGLIGEGALCKETSWRVVMRRALVALGLLVIRWRRISPGVSPKKGDNIT